MYGNMGFITDDYFNMKMKKVLAKDDEESLKAYKEYSIARDEIRDFLMYGDKKRKAKTYDLQLITKHLKEAIMYLIKDDAISKDSYTYIEQSMDITFPESMNCKWENGEVIYYIPNTYSDNKFLLF